MKNQRCGRSGRARTYKAGVKAPCVTVTLRLFLCYYNIIIVFLKSIVNHIFARLLTAQREAVHMFQSKTSLYAIQYSVILISRRGSVE